MAGEWAELAAEWRGAFAGLDFLEDAWDPAKFRAVADRPDGAADVVCCFRFESDGSGLAGTNPVLARVTPAKLLVLQTFASSVLQENAEVETGSGSAVSVQVVDFVETAATGKVVPPEALPFLEGVLDTVDCSVVFGEPAPDCVLSVDSAVEHLCRVSDWFVEREARMAWLPMRDDFPFGPDFDVRRALAPPKRAQGGKASLPAKKRPKGKS